MIRADQVVKVVEIIRANFGKEVALKAIEVPGEDYEAMLEQHRAMCRHSILGGQQDPTLPVVFEIGGVRIEKRRPHVSQAMREAGRKLMQSHEGMKYEELVARLYQEMREVEDREKRT